MWNAPAAKRARIPNRDQGFNIILPSRNHVAIRGVLVGPRHHVAHRLLLPLALPIVGGCPIFLPGRSIGTVCVCALALGFWRRHGTPLFGRRRLLHRGPGGLYEEICRLPLPFLPLLWLGGLSVTRRRAALFPHSCGASHQVSKLASDFDSAGWSKP